MQHVERLITHFVPEHYQLSLDLDRAGRTFSGVVTINGISPESTGQIIVHSKDLNIESVTVDGKTARFQPDEHDALVITHPDIQAGKHVVVIAFNGTINDAMHGLYPCYFEHDGTKKELLATQFESHHAREVFPCIDEPEAKAVFDLILTTEQNITVLSNMPALWQRVENNRLVTAFQTTPRMSTYLLAWVTGELHRQTATTASGVEVNVWSTPAQPLKSLDFALEHAVKTIDFFDEYFGTPYPLPKSDHVALPDFTAGAMENWGLITYREVALLTHPTASSVSDRQYIASVITHELSHQWFGNLVTMKWWDDLWLNESFATLMEYVGLDALYPEWDRWLSMSNLRNVLALRRDCIDGVQPVKTGVNHPDEISALFDASIVYAKGARLLRMLQHYVGETTFQKGLTLYFNTHAYGNTEADDLWRAISKASKKDIASFMNTWLTQSGYPVVHVTRNENTIHLHQERFFAGPHQPSETLWPIPLNAPGLPELLSTRDETIPLPETAPVRLNVGDTAHFITRYDDQLLAELVRHLPSLTPIDRLQLLHEQIMLSRSEETEAAPLVPLLQAYRHETSEPVWDMIGLGINELKPFVEKDTAAEARLRSLAVGLAHDQYEKLGWTRLSSEHETDTKLRATIISMMLYGEDNQAVDTATGLFHTTPLENLDPELRPLIIGATVRFGNDDTVFDELIDRYKTIPSASLRQDIMGGLTWTRDKAKVEQLLTFMTDSTVIRPQDVIYWFRSLIQNRHARELAWEWLRANWAWIEKTFGSDKTYEYFPRLSANVLCTEQHFKEYREFFTPLLDEPSLARSITMGMHEIEGRIDRIGRNTNGVREALSKL